MIWAELTGFWLVFLLVCYQIVKRLGSNGETLAAVCQPAEVLAWLRFELKGALRDGRFEGRHRERGFTISAIDGEWRIEIEGTPEIGDQRGDDALARILELARSPRGLSLGESHNWDAIVRIFQAHALRFEGGRLVAHARFTGDVLGVLDEAIRLRRLLDRLVEVTSAAQVALSVHAGEASSSRCPYCHDAIEKDGSALRLLTTECPKCGAPHHADCFTEHGGCAVFACSPHAVQGLRDNPGPGKLAEGSIRSV